MLHLLNYLYLLSKLLYKSLFLGYLAQVNYLDGIHVSLLVLGVLDLCTEAVTQCPTYCILIYRRHHE